MYAVRPIIELNTPLDICVVKMHIRCAVSSVASIFCFPITNVKMLLFIYNKKTKM